MAQKPLWVCYLHPRKNKKSHALLFYIHEISCWTLGCCSSVSQPCLAHFLPNLMLVCLISRPLVAGEPGKRNVTGFGLCHIGRKLAWRHFPPKNWHGAPIHYIHHTINTIKKETWQWRTCFFFFPMITLPDLPYLPPSLKYYLQPFWSYVLWKIFQPFLSSVFSRCIYI